MAACAAGALVMVLALPAAAAGAGTPDLSGVWMIASPITELKTRDGKTPPFNAAAANIYQQRRSQLKAGDLSFDPAAKCISPGIPRMLTLSYPFKIFQNDRYVLFSFQWNRWFRYAKLTKAKVEPPYPMAMGTSVGRWEGDTLVIDTDGLRAKNIFLDSAGMPLSDAMHLTERLRLVGPDALEDRITFSDPATFTNNWETVLVFKRQPPGTEIAEDVCFDRTDKGAPAIVR